MQSCAIRWNKCADTFPSETVMISDVDTFSLQAETVRHWSKHSLFLHLRSQIYASQKCWTCQKHHATLHQIKGHCYSYKERFDRTGNRQGHRSLLNTETYLTIFKPKYNDSYKNIYGGNTRVVDWAIVRVATNINKGILIKFPLIQFTVCHLPLLG